MTTDTLEPVYFAECRKALAAYYTGAGEKGASFLIKNIPGKLYKAGLLYDGIPTENAVDLCTSYAANRSYLIKQGASPDKAGDMALDEMLKPANETNDKDVPVMEPTQHYDPVATEYELTVFPRPDGALLHKASGLALAPTIQIRSNSPDAMFYLPQLVEMLMENLTELVNTGHYSINYDALSKDFRRNMESQGLPPKQVNELDEVFGTHPAKQGNATPKGNNQAQATRPAQAQQTQQDSQTPNAYTAEIVAVELIQSSKGTEGFKFYKLHDNQRKSIGGGEFRSNVSEPVLSALGFTVEDITGMNVGDMKGVKNKGVKAEYILEPQPDGKKWTKVTGYIKPDGSRI